jgi:hypothetical protein
MKQSVETDLPPVEGRTVATTQELRHLKGAASYLRKEKLR